MDIISAVLSDPLVSASQTSLFVDYVLAMSIPWRELILTVRLRLRLRLRLRAPRFGFQI